MTKYNTIPNDEEALLAPKKQKSFKGLVVAAAAISFTLGVVAAVATAPSDKLPKFTSVGNFNCWETEYNPDSSGEMNLAECFVDCSSDTKCHGVTLEWTNNGLVQCYKRGKIDTSNCQADGGFTTYAISP